MWIVKHLVGYGVSDASYMVIMNENTSGFSLVLTLLDTLSKKTVQFEFENELDALVVLRRYSPYGFIDYEAMFGCDYTHILRIDDYSLKFLEYVESVKRVRVKRGSSIEIDSILASQALFSSCDNHNTMFDCYVGLDGCCCTLLNACDYASNGWCGDSFYLNCKETSEDCKPGYYELYKVSFTDAKIARRFLTKVRVANNNPIPAELGPAW